jgi:hydrophobic/amphiphilic exporter-1 (mainly G- bacteria), HAE1 family
MAKFHDAQAWLSEATKGISGLAVRRPVLAIVANLLIVLAGLAAFRGIEVRELPDVDRPVITIRAAYDGATPETIDRQVTDILEGAAARVPGVKSISSTSRSGVSRVVVEFSESVDINVAANDLRDAVGNVERQLPEDVDDISIVKADDNSDAIMRLAATAENLSIQDLTQLVEDDVKDRLSAVEGVAEVSLFGEREPLVRVLIDPNAMATRGISVADLSTALATVASDAPAGSLSAGDQSLLVRADASVKNAEEIEAIKINKSTSIGDVADVVFGPAEETSSIRINGQTGIGLGIIRQAQSNTLEISNGVRAAVAEIDASLPPGVHLRVTSDESTFIGGALSKVLHTLGEATLIVVAVIFLFLRSGRATIIPAITVPIALIGTLAAIYLAGFSINILTLLAIVLATGLVVDDAIVVLENIERHRAMGMGARAAAVLGAKQVFFAVISTTATLAAVFIPISFFQGTAGRLFSEFGFVMAFSVILSAFVALTLCPMLASRILREHEGETAYLKNPLLRWLGSAGARVEGFYHRLLGMALGAPWVVVAASVAFAGVAAVIYTQLPEQLTPNEDRGVIPMSVNAPQGVSISFMDTQMRQIEAVVQPLRDSGEVTNIFLNAGQQSTNSGFVVLTLAPWEERSRSAQDIIKELNPKLQKLAGVQVSTRSANSLGIRGGGQGLRFAITGNDYNALADKAVELQRALEDDAAFDTVTLSYDTTQPELSVVIDRKKASDLGISVDTLGTALATLLDGKELGKYYVGGDEISVRAQAPDGMIDDPGDLENVFVRTDAGRMLPLASFVTVSETAVAPELPREGQRRAVPINATLAPGVDLRQAMNALEAVATGHLAPEMGIRYLGEAAALNETSSGVAMTFLFALVVVLLVLAAQFESFVSAIIIMFTVPFGLAAAVFAILLTGGSINIYSQIGLVMLVGIMSKNGILIVEFANQLRERGFRVEDAIREACRIRLRPVVMTMIATVAGGVPLVIMGGAGAEARQALGWIVVGGLGFAAIITLFVTPVAFLLLARFAKPRSAQAERLEAELGDVADADLLTEPGRRKPVYPVAAE